MRRTSARRARTALAAMRWVSVAFLAVFSGLALGRLPPAASSPPVVGRSRIWPKLDFTTKSLPRNLLMVLALAGDSTMTNERPMRTFVDVARRRDGIWRGECPGQERDALICSQTQLLQHLSAVCSGRRPVPLATRDTPLGCQDDEPGRLRRTAAAA